jgi:hypothetical protein
MILERNAYSSNHSYGPGHPVVRPRNSEPEHRRRKDSLGLQRCRRHPRVSFSEYHLRSVANSTRSIGPVDLTSTTVSNTSSVPTVTDSLFKQGTISTESIGISYVPTTSANNVSNGELDFGGVDTSKCVFHARAFAPSVMLRLYFKDNR